MKNQWIVATIGLCFVFTTIFYVVSRREKSASFQPPNVFSQTRNSSRTLTGEQTQSAAKRTAGARAQTPKFVEHPPTTVPDCPRLPTTVPEILNCLLKTLLQSDIQLVMTQVEDLATEADFVDAVFLNVNQAVTRVGVPGEMLQLLNATLNTFLKDCPSVLRKDIQALDPRPKTETGKNPGNITTHIFVIIPLNDPKIPEINVPKMIPKQFFNWKRIHFQILHARGVKTPDQPRGYVWIGAEPDDIGKFKRPAESYEAFDTRPMRVSGFAFRAFQVPRDVRFFIWEKQAAEFKECLVHSEAVQKKYKNKARGKKVTDLKEIRKYMTSIMSVKRLMQKHGIQSWLNCGTLLGWYRQCSLIPRDPDIDLLHFSDPDVYPQINADILKQKNIFKVLMSTVNHDLKRKDHRGFAWKLGVKSGINVDTYLYYSHKLYDMWIKKGDIKWIDFTGPVCSADLHGYRIYVLCSDDKNRDMNRVEYGPNFMTPD